MNRHRVDRLVAVAVAAGIAVSAAFALGSTANASAGSQVSCAKLKGSSTSQTLSHCSGPANLFPGMKLGKGTASSVLTSPPAGYQEGSITTWGNGGGTTSSGVNVTVVVGGACKPGSTKVDTITETGTVVSGTGPAAELVGDTLSGTVCYTPKSNKVKNLKGTTLNS
jgi:hypothetical protein